MILQAKETESGKMISSKELHEYLRVGRVFNSWIRGRIEKYGFELNTDYREVWVRAETGETIEKDADSTSMVNQGYQKDYFVTYDMAKELCVLENNEYARKARKYLIACEETDINIMKAKLHLLDGETVSVEKLEEWEKLVEMMRELHPTLFKFKKQMLNMIWQVNKLSDDVDGVKDVVSVDQ